MRALLVIEEEELDPLPGTDAPAAAFSIARG